MGKKAALLYIMALMIITMLAACDSSPPTAINEIPEVPEEIIEPEEIYIDSEQYTYKTLIWSDEFDGKELDETKWRAMIGTGESEGYPPNWGNHELQYYTKENAFIRDGKLVISIKSKRHKNMSYTSSRLTTSDLFSFTYGRVEARIKLPDCEPGIWPAFWMLPDGLPTEWAYGTWAASGEIDIMEARSRIPDEISGAAHYGGKWPNNVYSVGSFSFPDSGSISDWNVYTIEWFPDKIIWYINGLEYFRLNDWHTTGESKPKPFDQPFCLILNVAVGGTFDGGRKPSANFEEAEMLVDWVRVYQ